MRRDVKIMLKMLKDERAVLITTCVLCTCLGELGACLQCCGIPYCITGWCNCIGSWIGTILHVIAVG